MIFQTVFVLNNMPIPDVRLSGLDVEVIDMSAGATEYDLACWVSELGDRGHAVVEYNADLFDEATITASPASGSCCCGGALATPDARVGDLTMIPEAERASCRWVRRVRGCVEEPRVPLRLDELVARRRRRRPDAVAVSCRWRVGHVRGSRRRRQPAGRGR